MVWWGLAFGYGVGTAVNLLVGSMLAFLLIDRLVLGNVRLATPPFETRVVE